MDAAEVTVEVVREVPFKKAAKEALATSIMSAFRESESVELKDSYYAERRSGLEPQVFAIVLSVVANALAIAAALISIRRDLKKEGKTVNRVAIKLGSTPVIITEGMSVEEITKLIEAARGEKGGKEKAA